jgi:hypothetical protein
MLPFYTLTLDAKTKQGHIQEDLLRSPPVHGLSSVGYLNNLRPTNTQSEDGKIKP